MLPCVSCDSFLTAAPHIPRETAGSVLPQGLPRHAREWDHDTAGKSCEDSDFTLKVMRFLSKLMNLWEVQGLYV